MSVTPNPAVDSIREFKDEMESERRFLASGIGDLVLQTLSAEDPEYVDPAFRLMVVTALELKAIAIAAGTEVTAEHPSDDELSNDDIVMLLAAIGTRLHAGAVLCQRLQQARWPEGGPWLKMASDGNRVDSDDREVTP